MLVGDLVCTVGIVCMCTGDAEYPRMKGRVGKKDSSSSSSFLIFADRPYSPDVRSNLDFLGLSGRKRKLDYWKFNVKKIIEIDI